LFESLKFHSGESLPGKAAVIGAFPSPEVQVWVPARHDRLQNAGGKWVFQMLGNETDTRGDLFPRPFTDGFAVQ
jgi:hypothetical protein